MKTLDFTKNKMQKFLGVLMIMVGNIFAYAQEATHTVTTDGGGTTSTSTTTETWYTNPIYLAVGALILIILIALIARGNRRD